MIESEEKLTVEEQKEKIRQRYKGVNPDELDFIPATPTENFYEDTTEKRVAVYARVSTDDPRQTSSYELQKNHYMDVIDRHAGWKLMHIYADEGISGTSLRHRDAFLEMITDCREGKVDLIVTKSVSRFARNVLDCIGYVRQLAAMEPPIGVFFETENIYTLNPNSEMSLSFISTLAQEESHNKSEIMNASIEMRFRRGIFLTPVLLGYDHDEDGNLVVNEEEAQTVRLIFFMYLYGYTCTEISQTLTELGCKTKKQNTQWSPGAILQILQNERHCGDVLARKTWTPNYLNHKSKRNDHDRNQYRKRDHHEPIITRDDFIAVQRLISNAKYGNKGFLPELQVVPNGALKGFVTINSRWAGFTVEDYKKASQSVYDGVIDVCGEEELQVEVKGGDIDLRGFEIARSQFFDTQKKTCVTFSIKDFKFSIECIRKLTGVEYIEMLIHPAKHMLAIRPTKKDNRYAIKWCKKIDGGIVLRQVSGAAFLNTIYMMFDWSPECKYRIRGIRKKNTDETVMLFDMLETEVFIPNSSSVNEDSINDYGNDSTPVIATPKSVCGFPADWASNFGSEYYRHAQNKELEYYAQHGEWKINSEGQSYCDDTLVVTSAPVVKESIDQIIREMKNKGGTINARNTDHTEFGD